MAGGDDMFFDPKKSVAEPCKKEEVLKLVKLLEERSFKTYRARIAAHKRLSRRNNAWNASLISLATATTIASVGLLVDRNMYGKGGDALMVALAVLSLVASLVVSIVNYGSRSRAMESSYKRIQQISLEAESFQGVVTDDLRQSYLELRKEYEIAIESSENHSEADFHRSQGNSKRVPWSDKLISFTPYIVLAIPVGLIVPFSIWFINGI